MQYTGQSAQPRRRKEGYDGPSQAYADPLQTADQPPDFSQNGRSAFTPTEDEHKRQYARVGELKVSKSGDKLGANRRSVEQRQVARDGSSTQMLESFNPNSKPSSASAFKNNFKEIIESQNVESSSPKFPGLQHITSNETSSVPDIIKGKNIRYSIDVHPQYQGRQSSRKGSTKGRDLAQLSRYDRYYNIQEYYQIASAQHSGSKHDSTKSKSKRRKVLLSNKNGQDQMSFFNNDAAKGTIYSGRFDSFISNQTQQTRQWRLGTTPIIGQGHDVETSHRENQDLKLQEELLSAGTDGNTQYNEIMKRSQLETQKPFSPFPRIPKNDLDYKHQPTNVLSQKTFKKDPMLSHQRTESGTLAGNSPTQGDPSDENHSTQRMLNSDQHYAYPRHEQLVIQHIRNLKHIQHKRHR